MWSRRRMIAASLAGGAALATAAGADEPKKSLNDRLTGDITGVHDPCLIQDNGVFNLFCTGHGPRKDRPGGQDRGLIQWRTSDDLITWTLREGVINELPAWAHEAIPGAEGIWAPDISYFNGRFHLYYAVSTFGSNRSVIGLLTTPTLDSSDPAFGWKDEGLVTQSTEKDNYNAIDPNHVIGADGRHWLTFGSFWTGIKLIELDASTGKPKEPGAQPLSIARRHSPGAIEAPFIIRRGDFYYLFAAYDFCCRGTDSSYYTCVGRSAKIEGPFSDHDGKALMNDGGTPVLHASLDKTGRFKGPGGASVFTLSERQIIVYHAYDAQNKGVPTLRMQLLAWTPDGWPVAV